MTDDNDYKRASIWIDKNQNLYNFDWNKSTRTEKKDFIQMQFNKGLSGYEKSSQKLADGIDYIRGNKGSTIQNKTKNGKYLQIRELSGRIIRWVKI